MTVSNQVEMIRRYGHLARERCQSAESRRRTGRRAVSVLIQSCRAAEAYASNPLVRGRVSSSHARPAPLPDKRYRADRFRLFRVLLWQLGCGAVAAGQQAGMRPRAKCRKVGDFGVQIVAPRSITAWA